MQLSKLAFVLLSAISAGCSSLAPTYTQPVSPVPDTWPGSVQTSQEEKGTIVSNLKWTDFIVDAELKSIIELALENNRDLRIAMLNIEKAQALYGVAQAQTQPSLQIEGASLSTGAAGQSLHAYQINLSSAEVELDFFGRLKNKEEQALYSYLATEEILRSVQSTLIAQVSNAYLTIGAQRANLILAQKTRTTQREALAHTQNRYKAGIATLLDVSQAQRMELSAKADIADYEQQLAKAINALELLTGKPVPELLLESKSLAQLKAVSLDKLDAGVDSSVLQFRPDIIAAERQLQAANANIGAARAAFYPSIKIGASAGSKGSTISDLFSSGTGQWSFIPKINLPIFDRGVNNANLKIAQADEKIALAQYEKSIQFAFREVADALIEREALTKQVKDQTDLVSTTQHSLKLATERYNQGLDNHMNVLDAQRSLYGAQQRLIQLKLAQNQNHILLYKSLGGGA